MQEAFHLFGEGYSLFLGKSSFRSNKLEQFTSFHQLHHHQYPWTKHGKMIVKNIDQTNCIHFVIVDFQQPFWCTILVDQNGTFIQSFVRRFV